MAIEETPSCDAALRWDGLIVPMFLGGPMNGNALLTYVEWVLVPILAPSDLVIVDNLSAHKVSGVKEVIEVPAPVPTASLTRRH